jgi:large subunit ribosomal protein L17
MRSLIEKGRITTTEARAKEVRPAVEKLLTRAKRSTVANRRVLLSALGSEAVVSKLITTAEGYNARAGGYVRIVKMAPRKGDAARMALIEFV